MNKTLIRKIFAKIKSDPSIVEPYRDMLEYLKQSEGEDYGYTHTQNKELRERLGYAISLKKNVKELFEVYRWSLLFDAPNDFDSYLLYLEIDRNPRERFYQPRRAVLKPLVDALQALADNELDELFLSEPPRVGKTSMLLFFTTWLMGRNSEGSILYSAYSDLITRAFYNGALEVMNDPDTYNWKDVFPDAKIIQTNAQDETVNIDRKKRYPSLTCRSLYGTLNGACDCNYFLIADDLIGGIEEALNPDRLIACWSKVDNNLIPRAKEGAKLLWVGTRWSISDPAGIRMDLLENDERFKNRRYKIINLPALNEDDESNFDYDYGVGFSTDYYRQRRASFERNNDMASWQAQYMGEPIEREGALFRSGDFRYFDELPLEEPDRVFMPVDPAFGGGDFVASPVCYQYGSDVYVVDVVYTNEDKSVSQPLLVQKILKHNVKAMQIEANKAIEPYKDGVRAILNDKGVRINLTTKPAPTKVGKDQRIFDKASDIKEHMLFRESGKRTREYELFMQSVFSFKFLGKNKHDDAPDSLAMAMDMALPSRSRAEIFRRPF